MYLVKHATYSYTTSLLQFAQYQTVTNFYCLWHHTIKKTKMRSCTKCPNTRAELKHWKQEALKNLETKTLPPNKHKAFLIIPSLLDVEAAINSHVAFLKENYREEDFPALSFSLCWSPFTTRGGVFGCNSLPQPLTKVGNPWSCSSVRTWSAWLHVPKSFNLLLV